jgi:hypothetical protein
MRGGTCPIVADIVLPLLVLPADCWASANPPADPPAMTPVMVAITARLDVRLILLIIEGICVSLRVDRGLVHPDADAAIVSSPPL